MKKYQEFIAEAISSKSVNHQLLSKHGFELGGNDTYAHKSGQTVKLDKHRWSSGPENKSSKGTAKWGAGSKSTALARHLKKNFSEETPGDAGRRAAGHNGSTPGDQGIAAAKKDAAKKSKMKLGWKDRVYADLGMKKVKGALGGTYYESVGELAENEISQMGYRDAKRSNGSVVKTRGDGHTVQYKRLEKPENGKHNKIQWSHKSPEYNKSEKGERWKHETVGSGMDNLLKHLKAIHNPYKK